MMNKEEIRQYGRDLGADAVGFAAVEDYKSPRTPDPQSLLPGVKSLVVLAYREPNGSLDSPVPRIAMTARLAVMDLSKKNNYLMARFLEDRFQAKAAFIALSFPLNMYPPQMGLIGDLSLRHAAVAAGLGVFGRHNIVIHPKFGTRVLFTAVLTDLPPGLGSSCHGRAVRRLRRLRRRVPGPRPGRGRQDGRHEMPPGQSALRHGRGHLLPPQVRRRGAGPAEGHAEGSAVPEPLPGDHDGIPVRVFPVRGRLPGGQVLRDIPVTLTRRDRRVGRLFKNARMQGPRWFDKLTMTNRGACPELAEGSKGEG